MSDDGKDATSLYRFFNARNELLYVGITSRGMRRWDEHRKDKPWWGEVSHSSIEHFNSRQDALDAESSAITTEGPLYNIAGAVEKKPVSPPSPWRCHHCGGSVTSADGNQYGYIWSAQNSPHRPVKWREWWIITHYRCDPMHDVTGYWIGLDRISTADKIFEWVEHLGGKRDSGDWVIAFEHVALSSLWGFDIEPWATDGYDECIAYRNSLAATAAGNQTTATTT